MLFFNRKHRKLEYFQKKQIGQIKFRKTYFRKQFIVLTLQSQMLPLYFCSRPLTIDFLKITQKSLTVI